MASTTTSAARGNEGAAAGLAATVEDDLATHDLPVARIAAHDKAAWMPRSHPA